MPEGANVELATRSPNRSPRNTTLRTCEAGTDSSSSVRSPSSPSWRWRRRGVAFRRRSGTASSRFFTVRQVATGSRRRRRRRSPVRSSRRTPHVHREHTGALGGRCGTRERNSTSLHTRLPQGVRRVTPRPTPSRNPAAPPGPAARPEYHNPHRAKAESAQCRRQRDVRQRYRGSARREASTCAPPCCSHQCSSW